MRIVSTITGSIAMNMNVVMRCRQLSSSPVLRVLLFMLFVVQAIAGCDAPHTDREAHSATDPATTPSPTTPPPHPLLDPPVTLVEQPLQGELAELPEVWLVPSLQSKTALAGHLKTTVMQLDWVNPGLPDVVSPGTLIVVPPPTLVHSDSTALTDQDLALGSESDVDVTGPAEVKN